MKQLPVLLIIPGLILSFFFGILFEKSRESDVQNQYASQKSVVNIEVLKTKLKIHSDNPNILFLADGKPLGEGSSIELP